MNRRKPNRRAILPGETEVTEPAGYEPQDAKQNGKVVTTVEIPPTREVDLLVVLSDRASSEAGWQSHLTSHLNISALTMQQRKGLQVLYNGLFNRHMTLASTLPIKSKADAIRWLLEQLSDL